MGKRGILMEDEVLQDSLIVCFEIHVTDASEVGFVPGSSL